MNRRKSNIKAQPCGVISLITVATIIADIICSLMAKQMDKRAEKQQRKFVFCIGDEVRGMAWTKMYDVSDYADYYRAGGLRVVKRAG